MNRKMGQLHHAIWRVNFLRHLSDLHKRYRNPQSEAWQAQDADYDHRLREAEKALAALRVEIGDISDECTSLDGRCGERD